MKYFTYCFLFIALFITGLCNLSPTISGGDTTELAGAGATLGIAHSPGYPLYCLLGRIFTFILPFGNYAYRMNLMSLFFGCLTAVFVFFIVSLLIDNSMPLHVVSIATTKQSDKATMSYLQILLAVISALSLFFSVQVFSLSLVSEVFTLNTFFATILIFISLTTLVKYRQTIPDRLLYLCSFIFGLGLGNHHTLILFLPALAFFYLKKFLKPISLIYAAGFFLIGLSIYLYVPIRSFNQPLFDWEDPQTPQRFLGLVTRARYGSLQLAQGGPPELSFGLLINQFIIF